MKKRFSKVLSLVLASAMVLSVAACGKKDTGVQEDTSELNGTYDITVWVSESEGVADLTKKQIAAFCEENPGIVINATVEGITEAESATQMITSVEDGADLFCFAQDQLSRLVLAGALNKLGTKAAETVTARNDAGSIKAASVGGALYCYPLTSDNGYFMYYDKSVIPAEHLDSFEDIIADCEKAGRLFSFETTSSGWYSASFFFATGCVSEWTTDITGNFTSVNDTFNSDAGVIALRGMQKLLKSPANNSSSAGADFAAAVPSAVLISGTWASSTVKAALGDNYAATDLPSFTVDGKSYHLGSFSGCKLVGIKPQVDAKKTAVLQKLALYLTDEKCQLERFDLVGWGPSNLAAQKADRVVNDVALAALALQSPYSVPQGNIHGSWWDISKTYATGAKEAALDDVNALKATLQTYQDTINGLFAMSVDEKEAWSVIGSMNGDGWTNDISMMCDSKGVWHSQAIKFVAGDEFKARQGKSWTVNIGGDGQADGANYKVEEDGYFFVKFTYDKDSNTGSILLEKTSDPYGFSVIGAIAGTNWDTDFVMEIQPDGSWISRDAFDLKAKDEFKCRFGKSWDESYGDGAANYVVTADTTCYIKLTTDYKIELIAK